ncbi:MAG TPA: glycosyltransferase [Phycisphaerae bacterium]|nr:glycosyltransferase [Phycisphaerae bacterium]
MDEQIQNPRRVLILSASAGAGHVRAAEALLKVFDGHSGVSEVAHWDMLKYTTKIFRHIYSQVYLDLINHAPTMLGILYDTLDKPWQKEKARLAFEKFNAGPFLKAVTKFAPDLIVCTHFTPAALTAWLYENKRLSVKPAIVVTDFDCHATWLTHTYLYYFVILDETREHLIRLGIDPARICVSGIPIDPVFMKPKTQKESRRRLELREDLFTILVSAGGNGVGPMEMLVAELLQINRPVQIVVIAGRSVELKTRLDELAAQVNGQGPVRLVPVGYTNQMDEYMAAADILLGKPGGMTSGEAMARNLPMCIFNPIPGQEERNSDHLLELGTAIRCNNLPTTAYKLQLLMDDPKRLAMMRQNTAKIAHPDSAKTIVDTLLNMPSQRPPHKRRGNIGKRLRVGGRLLGARMLNRVK